MADLPPVTVEITANISQFNDAIAQVQRSLAALGVQSQNTAQQQEAASSRAATASTNSARQIESANRRASSSFTNLGDAANAAFVTLGAARSGNYFYAFAAGSQFLTKFTSNLGGASLGMKALGGAGIAAAIGVTAVATAGVALFEAAKAPIEMAANFQVLKIQLEGLLGSAERANQEFRFLTELGQKSIVPTQALIEADRQLLAFGVHSDTTRQQMVKFFSDFGTATSATSQQIYFMSLALGQVSAAGKANMVDLRQLANAGINLGDLYQIVGDHIGKSAQYVSEHVQDGIFSAPILFAALNEYGKKYEDTAEKARNSTQGILANIKDIVEVGFGNAFSGLNEQISAVLKNVQNIVMRIDFKGLAAGFQTAFNQISAVLQGINWNGLLRFFNDYMPKAIAVTGAVIASFISVFRGSVSVINMIGQSVYMVTQAIIRAIANAGIAVTNFNDFLAVVSDEQADIDRRKWTVMGDNATKAMDGAKITMGKTIDDLLAISSVPVDITIRTVFDTKAYDQATSLLRGFGKKSVEEKPFNWDDALNLTGLNGAVDKTKKTFTDIKATLENFGNGITETMGRIPHVTSEVASQIRDGYQNLVNDQKAILNNFLNYANSYYNKMVGYLDLSKAFGDANDAKKRAADSQKALDKSLSDQNKAIAKAQEQYANTVAKTQASIDKSQRDAEQKLVAAQTNLADKQRQTDTQTAQIQMDLALKVSALRNGLESRHHASRLLYDMDAARTQDQINQAQIDAAARLNALQESLQTGSAADAVAKAQQDLTDLSMDSAQKLADAKSQADETLASVVESQKDTVSQAQAAYDEAASAAAVSYVDRFKQQISDVKNWMDVSSKLLQSGVKQALVDQIGSQGPAAGTELGNQLLSDQGLLGTLKDDWHTITEGVAATANALYEQFGQETGGFLGTTTGQAAVGALTEKMRDMADAWKATIQRLYRTTVQIDVHYNYINPPASTNIQIPHGALPAYADGGYVSSTSPALIHAGEFVLSNAMLAGKQSVPREIQSAVSNVNNSRNANITVNALTNADPHVIGKEIAWAIRTSV